MSSLATTILKIGKKKNTKRYQIVEQQWKECKIYKGRHIFFLWIHSKKSFLDSDTYTYVQRKGRTTISWRSPFF